MGKLTTSELLDIHSKLKLQIELVPESCWFSNVRSHVSIEQWGIIRSKVCEKAEYHCEICGGEGSRHAIECHEVWGYDQRTHIQKLLKFQALCPPCHEVKHFGLAEVRGRVNKALMRFALINEITIQKALKIIEAVKIEWRYRSSFTWSLDIGLLEEYDIIIQAP